MEERADNNTQNNDGYQQLNQGKTFVAALFASFGIIHALSSFPDFKFYQPFASVAEAAFAVLNGSCVPSAVSGSGSGT
jgi:hypothetical protein